jgi:hypothetical protein
MTEFSKTVVATIMGKSVTQGELSDAFDKVTNKANWKLPIKKTVVLSGDFEMEMIREAVVFFTGSKATFKAKGLSRYEVKAAGYYAVIGA